MYLKVCFFLSISFLYRPIQNVIAVVILHCKFYLIGNSPIVHFDFFSFFCFVN